MPQDRWQDQSGGYLRLWRPVLPHVLLMVVLLAVATGMTITLIQIQHVAMSYLDSAGVWSQSRISAVAHLERYLASGDPRDLAIAREELDVLDGYRQARAAMDAPALDREAAREGFRRGRVPPEQIPGMIHFYRWLHDLPHFSTASELWRDSDALLDELHALANATERRWAMGSPGPAWIAATRVELAFLHDNLGSMNENFRSSLQRGTSALRTYLASLIATVMLLMSAIALIIGWRMSRVIAASEDKFRSIFAQAGVGLAQLNARGHFIEVNQALSRMLGYDPEMLLGHRYVEFSHPEDLHIATRQGNLLREGRLPSATVEQRFIRGNGEPVWLRISASPMAGTDPRDARYIAVVEDVTESRRLSAELDYQAEHDLLTGLINRRALERKLAELLGETRGKGGRHSLCFIDLDQFKVLNDTCGHAAGDQALREVSQLLIAQVREHDTLARLGADEFALLMEDCDLAAGEAICQKLHQALAGFRFDWEGQKFNLTASMGLVEIRETSAGVESLLRSADIATHIAKDQGRNQVHVSTEEDPQVAEWHGQMEWVSRIEGALEEDRFFLEAQYLTPLNVSDELRYELLIRMRGPDGERCSPGEFLPPAERYGAIHKIDRWVMATVCRQLAAHPRHLERLSACHINISGDSLGRPDFQDSIEELLDRYAVPAEKLCLEITETAAIAHLGNAQRFMERLAARGCSFALDDFGAGLSSFGYLRTLNAQFLKIDGTFVRDMDRDRTDLAMVRAIHEVGRTLGKQTIAECVETREVGALLREMGVHYAQGFGYHRPEAWEHLLKSGRPRPRLPAG